MNHISRREFLLGAAAFAAFVSVGAVANVPEPRNVPELMKTFRGEHVKTIAEWEGVCAPEILERYRREVFGVQPQSWRAGSACNVTSWTDRRFSGRRTSGA